MDFGWTPELEQFRDEVNAFIEKNRTPALVAELGEWRTHYGRGPEAAKFRQALNETGYTTMAWPEEYGGQGKGAFYIFILNEQLAYHGLPFDNMSITSIGNTLMSFASEEQKKEWLPKVQTGEITFALGYTEPNAGTDLASLQTRAVRDGDEWVINGQKIYTSSGHISSHIWLAARTDPDAPKHRGISMFVLPMDTPGITVRPLWTMGEGRTNETFWEDVRVPAMSLVGEENRGWYMASNALDLERVVIGPYSPLMSLFDETVDYVKEKRPDLLGDPVMRTRIAQSKMDVEIARGALHDQRHHHQPGPGTHQRSVDGEGLGDGGPLPHDELGHRSLRWIRWPAEGQRRLRRRRGRVRGRVPFDPARTLRRRHERHPATHHRHARVGPAARLAQRAGRPRGRTAEGAPWTSDGRTSTSSSRRSCASSLNGIARRS